MRITAKGQVTIPQSIREAAGLLPHMEVEFVFEGGEVKIVKAATVTGETPGDVLIRLLAGKATDNLDLTTDDILNASRSEPPASRKVRRR